MKYPFHHPSFTAYYRELERELFILDHGKEYGDNVFIESHDQGHVPMLTTLSAIKIMAFNELMKDDPVSKLQDALEALVKDPMDAYARANARVLLGATKRYGRDWK